MSLLHHDRLVPQACLLTVSIHCSTPRPTMHPLPSDPASQQRLSTDAPTFYYGYLDAIDRQSVRASPGLEGLSPLAAGYEVPVLQNVWQPDPCSAEIPEDLWCTQGSNSTIPRQSLDGASILDSQVPFDDML